MAEKRERDDRNILLFGDAGQKKIRATSAVVAGSGGLGSALGQHLALLGVGRVAFIDNEELDETNRNRFIGARHDDPVPGTPKVEILHRLVGEIDPSIDCIKLNASIASPEAFDAVKRSDWIFGCFDDDGPRAILNELTAAYTKPYIDLASDVPEPGHYGGRVCVSIEGRGCIDCLGLMDRKAVRAYLDDPAYRKLDDQIYGVRKNSLTDRGPSVAPVNGVIAALAATEFMVGVTGMRTPTRLQEYRGNLSKVVVVTDMPRERCPRCSGVWGLGADADVERYLRIPHLRSKR